MPKVTLAFNKHKKDILRISSELDDEPWTEQELSTLMLQLNHIFYVVEDDTQTLGFIYWKAEKDYFVLHRIAVDSSYWRQGLGTMMLKKLQGKCSIGKLRPRIEVCVAEENLRAQLFFKANGFVATEILDYEYKMVWRKKK